MKAHMRSNVCNVAYETIYCSGSQQGQGQKDTPAEL